MSAAYLVIYEGRPHRPEEWLRYYRDVHVPLVWQLPGLRGVELHVGRDGGDVFMVTRLRFDSLDELRRAITSAPRVRTREDMEVHLLPSFEGRVRHQVTEVIEVGAPH
ncbi:MAG: EthD family reductase [Acidimicrobiia bacterium]